MATAKKYNWIRVYKDLSRIAAQFPQYNYRQFAQRRIRDYFQTNRSVTDETRLAELYQDSQRALQSLRRQVHVSSEYPYRPLVIENLSKPEFSKNH